MLCTAAQGDYPRLQACGPLRAGAGVMRSIGARPACGCLIKEATTAIRSGRAKTKNPPQIAPGRVRCGHGCAHGRDSIRCVSLLQGHEIWRLNRRDGEGDVNHVACRIAEHLPRPFSLSPHVPLLCQRVPKPRRRRQRLELPCLDSSHAHSIQSFPACPSMTPAGRSRHRASQPPSQRRSGRRARMCRSQLHLIPELAGHVAAHGGDKRRRRQ